MPSVASEIFANATTTQSSTYRRQGHQGGGEAFADLVDSNIVADRTPDASPAPRSTRSAPDSHRPAPQSTRQNEAPTDGSAPDQRNSTSDSIAMDDSVPHEGRDHHGGPREATQSEQDAAPRTGEQTSDDTPDSVDGEQNPAPQLAAPPLAPPPPVAHFGCEAPTGEADTATSTVATDPATTEGDQTGQTQTFDATLLAQDGKVAVDEQGNPITNGQDGAPKPPSPDRGPRISMVGDNSANLELKTLDGTFDPAELARFVHQARLSPNKTDGQTASPTTTSDTGDSTATSETSAPVDPSKAQPLDNGVKSDTARLAILNGGLHGQRPPTAHARTSDANNTIDGDTSGTTEAAPTDEASAPTSTSAPVDDSTNSSTATSGAPKPHGHHAHDNFGFALNNSGATFGWGTETFAPQTNSGSLGTLSAPGFQLNFTPLATAQVALRTQMDGTTSGAVPLDGVAMEITSRILSGKSRFEIRLDPADLGRIDVQMDVDQSGNLTTRLFVEKSETLDLLKRDAPNLERALQDAGLKTSDQSLQFSLRDQSSNNRDDTPNGRSLRGIVSEDDAAPAPVALNYGRGLMGTSGLDIRV